MKLDGNNIIDYNNIPTSKPKSVSLNGIIYDARNPFWELEENDETSKLVNAIEIAWNGAEVTGADSTNLAQDDPVTINTTSELLTWIQQMVSKERFFALLQQYIGSNSLDIQVQGGKLYIDTNIPVEPPVTNKYYWYIGQTKPTNLSSDPTVTTITSASSIPNNSWVNQCKSNGDLVTLSTNLTKLYGRGINGDSTKPWYVAIPEDLGLTPTATDYTTPDTAVTDQGTITINGKVYKYYSYNPGTRCAAYYAKL